MQQLSKQTDETKLLVFNYADSLAAGETIASKTVTVTLVSGYDATPSAMLSGSSAIAGSTVTQLIAGGTLYSTYIVACNAVTSAGQLLDSDWTVNIESAAELADL